MKKIFSILYIGLVLAFIYVPIAILIVYSFNSGKTIGVWSGFSFEWYGKLGDIQDVIINTLLLAVITSCLATVLGTLGAIGMFYNKGMLCNTIN